MKPYYKQNGFFDRLERLSDWIDDQIDKYLYIIRKFGFLYYVPMCRHMAIMGNFINHCADYEIYYRKTRIDKINQYNREKYWWMRAK